MRYRFTVDLGDTKVESVIECQPVGGTSAYAVARRLAEKMQSQYRRHRGIVTFRSELDPSAPLVIAKAKP